VHIEETTLTVYDGQAVLTVAPRQSTTAVSRFRAKHEIRPLGIASDISGRPG
jgi:hypothetical protein